MTQNFTPLSKNLSTHVHDKPIKLFRYLSYLLLVISLLYGYTYFNTIAVPLIFDFQMAKAGLTLTSKHMLPNFEILSLITFFITSLFLYLGLKIRHGQKKTFLISLFALFFIPGMGYLYQSILASSLKQFPKSLSLPMEPSFRIISVETAIGVIFAILGLYHRNKFIPRDTPLSKKEKIVFLSINLVLLLLFAARIAFAYIRYYDRDYGYTKIQKQTDFHVYKPTYLPWNYKYSTVFSKNSSIDGLKNVVQVTFDPDLITGPINHETLWLRQTRVDKNFDLENFIQKNLNGKDIEKVNLPYSKNNSGYFFKLKPLNTNILMYVTHDDVLIFLASFKLTKDQLSAFASLLK